MQVIVNRTEFLKKLRIVEKAISENKIKPILSCVYMETRGEMLFLCGTNLETTITTTVSCKEVVKEGKVAFQYPLIDEYMKELKEEEIQIRMDGEALIVEGGDAVSEFSTFPYEDYPKAFENFEKREENVLLQMNSIELATIFDKLKFSAGSTDNPAIHCVRIEGRDGEIHFVTTDTYRLTYLHRAFSLQEDFQMSLPLEAVEACSKIFRGLEAEVRVYFDKKFAHFLMEDIHIVSSLIELTFPAYQTILSNGNYDKTMGISTESLISILRRVIIFVRNNEESKYGATFHLAEGILKIKGNSDIAKINEEMAVNYQGAPLKVSLNTKYLFDYVQNLEKDTELSVEMLSSKTSVKVHEKGKEDYIYILMPLALKD